ncbi:MAG: aspartate aminotransferase family protein [Planctomycetes bacterium]|nr:aspartate aminotransferase family protein [Planctomycetota bacterium]
MSAAKPIARVPLPVCDHKPAPYDGPGRDEILTLRREYLNPGVLMYYKEPLCIVEGHMQYLWDETGKQYLDAIAGIVTVSVGHCHPKITERIREQVGRLVHATTIYLHPTVVLFAKELARRMPQDSGLKSTYFTSSGSEANDLAILMARLHTGRSQVLSLRNAYHGGSSATMALTAVGTWKYPIADPSGTKHIVPGYCYRCPFGLEYPSCDLKCATSAEDVIRYETSGEIAAFIAEPIQGVGGTVTPPPEYFQIVYDIVRKHGGLCIADEVQSGFGRTGEHYWGFENWGVTPDLVVMAKGIGNGAPLGACTTRPEIAQTMSSRLHFNTFGGNPVSMIQGLAVLEIIDDENIQQNAREVGGYLKQGLLELQEKHALIGEVRGLGLMLGVELVKDRQTKEPATAEAADLVEKCKARGLLLGKGGLYGNVIRIKPPMCITKSDCDFLVDCLDACLESSEPC